MSAVLDAPVPRSPIPPTLQRQFELIRLSAVRQLRARYRGSALGVLWSFANPVLMTAIYAAIFGTAFARYYGGSTNRYILSAFIGVVVVTFFLQATTEALISVVANGGLLNKIAIGPETFPFAALAANAFQQAITTFPLLIVVAAVVTHDPVRVVLAPVVLAALVALTGGFALALAALYVFFRDLANVWSILGFILWLTSPVFYPAALVPASVRQFIGFNPVAVSVTAIREVIIGTGPLNGRTLATFLVVAVAVAIVGYALFKGLRREFMDLI